MPGSQRTYIDANVELYTSLQGRMDDMGIFLGTCCWWLVLRGTEKREARSKKRTDQLCKNYFYKKIYIFKKIGERKKEDGYRWYTKDGQERDGVRPTHSSKETSRTDVQKK